MNNNALEPCQCGRKPKVKHGKSSHGGKFFSTTCVACDCGMNTGYQPTRGNQAKRIWNTRATIQSLPESAAVDVEKLKRDTIISSVKNNEEADPDNSNSTERAFARGIEYAIDHLHREGFLSAPKASPTVEFIPELESALLNAVEPSFDIDVIGPDGNAFTTNNGEWLIWCGDKEHAEAILKAARRYAEMQKGNE